MNIKQIISEAIDRTVLANYSTQMGRYLGEFGLDQTPLGNDRTSLSFIREFNNFCFQVKYAIDDKNFRKSGTRQTVPGVNGLEYDRYQSRPGDSLTTKFVNMGLDMADDAYHYAGNQINLDPIFGGMGRSFRNGYNNGVDAFKPDPTELQQQQQPVKSRTTRTRVPKSGVDLTTLMGNPYVKVTQDYRYAYQLNPTGLSRIRGLRELITILENIKNALRQQP